MRRGVLLAGPLFAGICAAALLSACAGKDIRLVPLSVELPANPAQGKAVRIEAVTDSRRFELQPRQSHDPSLLPEDVNNAAIRQRAIGRQRDGFGKALGEVLLPEGQSVPALIRDATIQAFRRSGYRVLSAGEPGFAQAAPVKVTIKTYWNWMGSTAIGNVSCRAEATLQAPFAPLKDGMVIAGIAQQDIRLARSSQAAGERDESAGFMEPDWPGVSSRCLTAYSDNLKAMLTR